MLDMLGGLFDKEKMVEETIQKSLKRFAKELGCNHNELFVTIVPSNEKFSFDFLLYEKKEKPKFVRKIELSEILGG